MKILFAIIFVSLNAQALVYRGTIDTSSNNVTTTYESIMAVAYPGKVRRIACTNYTVTPMWISLTGVASNCSDANDDWLMAASGNGAFVFDNFPIGNRVCVKATAGTVSSGIIQCIAYWNEVTP